MSRSSVLRAVAHCFRTLSLVVRSGPTGFLRSAFPQCPVCVAKTSSERDERWSKCSNATLRLCTTRATCQSKPLQMRKRAVEEWVTHQRHSGASPQIDGTESLRSFAPTISMVKAAEPGTGDHRRGLRRLAFHWPSVRCVLIERIVNPVVVIVVHVITNEPPQMLFVQRDDMVENLTAAAAYPTFRNPILPGCLNTCAFRLQAGAFKKPITSVSNFASWSRMT
jgi:hypothetical protein